MEQMTLKATKREGTGSGNSGRLRRAGKVPGIVYGQKLDTTHVTVEADDINRLIGSGVRMFDLDVDGSAESVMIRDLQFDPMGDMILHIDFSRIAMDVEIHIDVSIEFHGEPAGISEGGKLQLGVHQINVACLPTAVPESIRAELSALNIGDALHVRELEMPEGIRLLTNEDVVVALVRAPVKEVEETDEEKEGEAAEGAEGEADGDAEGGDKAGDKAGD